MRDSHKSAPFHRIKAWNGAYFRPASLWEVGTYLLVQHHDSKDLCDTLQFQKHFLDAQQDRRDVDEQTRIREKEPGPGPGVHSGPESSSSTFVQTEIEDIDMTYDDEILADTAFEEGLNSLSDNSMVDDFVEDNFDPDAAETDIHNVVEYLGPYKEAAIQVESLERSNSTLTSVPNSIPNSRPGPEARPTSDGLNNSYVHVLHTNGIHHIAMVTCSCQGQDRIPLDLVACRLLPASFIRIRTIFTSQLMDHFCLCNLELKASAYQFYQLIRRLTLPIGQSELVNLYHEFRRMSRLWRWMKKLKWAGYGHNKKDHLNPAAGSLAIFCPTCPQSGLNLPEHWKQDLNR
jgi:CxC2 like cysteine cluster associated with KDZ transposases